MILIGENRINKTLKVKAFLWNFEIERDGIYAIEATASCKSWFQNLFGLRSFFKDDDLAVIIDEIEFPKKGLKTKRLFDGGVAWNGNNLKGLKKTDLFVIRLRKGAHTLKFLADQSPKIETIRIYQLEEKETQIEFLPKDNYPIEDGNRRQWLTFILVNLDLKSLRITASAKEGKKFFLFKRDDSDLKLTINGEIQKNQEPKSHQYWYWCGRTLKGKTKTFERELKLTSGLHYIEFWADRNPEVKEIKIKILEKIPCPVFNPEDIQKYTYRGVKEDEDYNRFDKEILETVNFWNKFFFFQRYPPKGPLNPNLVKAIIYVESRMGYAPGGFPDVMQVWDEANGTPQTIKGEEGYSANEYISDTKYAHMSYSYSQEWLPPKVETPRESIFWGVRWLYHKAQKLKTEERKLVYAYQREWINWEDTLSRYNPHSWYKERVLKIHREGVDQDGNVLWGKNSKERQGKVKILLLFLGLSLLLGGVWLFYQRQKDPLTEEFISNTKIIKEINFNKDTRLGVLQEVSSANIGLAILNKKREIEKWLPKADFSSSQADHFNWFEMGDFNNDALKEIAFELQYIGSVGTKPFYLYQKRNDNFELLLFLFDSASQTFLKDFNHDGIFEIEHHFSLDGTSLSGRTLTKWKEIRAWKNGKYEKVNNLYPEIYRDSIKYYEDILKDYPDKQAMIHYQPIIKCLKQKAELNLKGIFADGRECVILIK